MAATNTSLGPIFDAAATSSGGGNSNQNRNQKQKAPAYSRADRDVAVEKQMLQLYNESKRGDQRKRKSSPNDASNVNKKTRRGGASNRGGGRGRGRGGHGGRGGKRVGFAEQTEESDVQMNVQPSTSGGASGKSNGKPVYYRNRHMTANPTRSIMFKPVPHGGTVIELKYSPNSKFAPLVNADDSIEARIVEIFTSQKRWPKKNGKGYYGSAEVLSYLTVKLEKPYIDCEEKHYQIGDIMPIRLHSQAIWDQNMSGRIIEDGATPILLNETTNNAFKSAYTRIVNSMIPSAWLKLAPGVVEKNPITGELFRRFHVVAYHRTATKFPEDLQNIWHPLREGALLTITAGARSSSRLPCIMHGKINNPQDANNPDVWTDPQHAFQGVLKSTLGCVPGTGTKMVAVYRDAIQLGQVRKTDDIITLVPRGQFEKPPAPSTVGSNDDYQDIDEIRNMPDTFDIDNDRVISVTNSVQALAISNMGVGAATDMTY